MVNLGEAGCLIDCCELVPKRSNPPVLGPSPKISEKISVGCCCCCIPSIPILSIIMVSKPEFMLFIGLGVDLGTETLGMLLASAQKKHCGPAHLAFRTHTSSGNLHLPLHFVFGDPGVGAFVVTLAAAVLGATFIRDRALVAGPAPSLGFGLAPAGVFVVAEAGFKSTAPGDCRPPLPFTRLLGGSSRAGRTDCV